MNKRETILIVAWLVLLVIAICLLVQRSDEWTPHGLRTEHGLETGLAVSDSHSTVRPPVFPRSQRALSPASAEAQGVSTSLWEQEVDRVRTMAGSGSGSYDTGEFAEAEELCALLAEELANGESDKTIALGARIVALGDEAVDVLATLVNSGNPEEEVTAVRLLCRIGTVRAIAVALGRMLGPTPDEAHAVRLLDQFAGIRSPAVAGLLTDMMGETEQVEVMHRIGSILNAMEGPFAVRALADGIANPINEAHRQECISALAGMKRPSNIHALEQMLSDSNDAEVDASIAQALAGIGNQAACDVLVAWAGRSDRQDSIFVSALSSVSSPYGQQVLLNILESSDKTQVRVAAAQALGNYDSTHLRERLSNRASSEKSDIVKTAILDSVQRMERNAEGSATSASAGELIEMSDR